jgi:hypothetical protein
MNINSISIDSTNSITDLCIFGTTYPTDKSPYNKDPSLHKHAYTSIYNLLFSHIRYNNIKFGEIGILDNHSMMCWRKFFPNAKLYGFEYYNHKIHKALKDKINCSYININVTNRESITNAFDLAENNFDILIDDSTHIFDDQINIIDVAYKYLNPGAFLIIEDIYLSYDEKKYCQKLSHLSSFFSSATFIFANHDLKHSPGWDNDKLLVLHRNNKLCS